MSDTYETDDYPEAAELSEDVDPRPIIKLDCPLHDVVDAGLDALSRSSNVYQRNGALVYVVRVPKDEEQAHLLAGTPVIRTMSTAVLASELSRVARWVRPHKTKGWVEGYPDMTAVGSIQSYGLYRTVRPITGITETPTLRPDGTVFDTPGYDKATGYLHIPYGDFDPIPEEPTQAEACAALAELCEVFSDFPYADASHMYVPIAAILSIIGRPAINGPTPMFAFGANCRGTGKTLGTDCVSIVATGRPAPKKTWVSNDEETEKVLAAYALQGAVIAVFDNVDTPLRGAALDKVLTAVDKVDMRVLGSSQCPSLTWRAVLMCSGNNLVVDGDTARRTLLCQIESMLERPEDREDFKHHPLIPWVMRERQRLARAALLVLRAWFSAGCPKMGCKTWGSFESWSAIIPPAIVYAGGMSPMACRISNEEGTPEVVYLSALLGGLHRLFETAGSLSVKGVISSLYSDDVLKGNAPPDGFEDMRDAIEYFVATKPGSRPDPRKLGDTFRKFKKRVVGGRRLTPDGITGGVARWKVEAV